MALLPELRLRQRFSLLTALALTALLVILSIVIYRTQENRILSTNEARMISHIEDLESLLDLEVKEKQEQVSYGLKVADYVLEKAGGIVVTDDTLKVNVYDDRIEDSVAMTILKWEVGGTPIVGSNKHVDMVRSLIREEVTIFQKVDNGYLKISTTLTDEDGNRLVNTFIPNNSPAIATVEKGLIYRGRTNLLDKWYLSAYQPILDNGEVIGMIFVGVEEKDLPYLREKLQEKSYFESGFPYCFNQEGDLIIHPNREGANISNDDYVKQIFEQKQGKVNSILNDRVMIHFFAYYEPYNLYLVATVPQDEYINEPLRDLRYIILVAFSFSLATMLLIVNYLVKKLSDDIKVILTALKELAQGRYGTKTEVKRQDEIGEINKALNTVTSGLNEAARFAEAIGSYKFDVKFEPLSRVDRLGNALLAMRNNLSKVAQEDKNRNWANEGFAKFAELLRNNYESQEKLADVLLEELVKYMNANQAAFFAARVDQEQNEYLELIAQYAWNRKQYRSERILKGEGLAGQAWIEKDLLFITDIPESYIAISSGLGKANPRNIIIAPLIFNNEVFGVIEIASFNLYEKHEVEFVRRLSDSIASTISAAKVNERTKLLLQESQQKGMELQSREEEMRQNMEELQATQEEMRRKAAEVENRIIAINESGIISAEFDLSGILLAANENFARLMVSPKSELIGKPHRTFITPDQEQTTAYKTFFAELGAGNIKYGQFKLLNRKMEPVYIKGAYSLMQNDRIVLYAYDITDSVSSLTPSETK